MMLNLVNTSIDKMNDARYNTDNQGETDPYEFKSEFELPEIILPKPKENIKALEVDQDKQNKYVTHEELDEIIDIALASKDAEIDKLRDQMDSLTEIVNNLLARLDTEKPTQGKKSGKPPVSVPCYKVEMRESSNHPFEDVGEFKTFREMAPTLGVSHSTCHRIFKGLSKKHIDIYKITKI